MSGPAPSDVRVLKVLGPSTGGIRRHVAFLSEQLRSRGWDVEIAGPAGVLDGIGTLNHSVPVPSGLSLRALPAAVRALRRLIPGYDVVHAHGLTAGWVALLARRGRRRPRLVVTAHNVVLDAVSGRRARVLRTLERGLLRRADAVLPGGGLGPPPSPRRGATDVRRELGVGDAPLVVSVARLHPQKGLDVLLSALPKIRARVSAVRVAIIGEGPLERSLRDQATALGLDSVVRFGRSANPADELAAADVVVISSRWESGPLVLTEAAALGRPIVATPVGVVGDVITDGESGWVVPIDDADALADAVTEALTDAQAATTKAEAARARALRVTALEPQLSLVEGAYRASLGR